MEIVILIELGGILILGINKYIKSKNIIYPITLSKKFNISLEESFKLLNSLLLEGLLERVYEFRCSSSRFRIRFENINYINLPNRIYCSECQKEHNLKYNLYVIYRKAV